MVEAILKLSEGPKVTIIGKGEARTEIASEMYVDGIETGQQCHNIEAETRQSKHENNIHHGNIKRYPNINIRALNNRQKSPCLNDKYLKHS